MCTEESLAVKIDKEHGEQTRIFLRENNLLRTDLKIKKNHNHLFIPIIQSSKKLKEFSIVTETFEKNKQNPSHYQELLDLNSNLQNLLPTSFDVIGDIILIKIPKELQEHSSKIGNALLQTHSHVNTVCNMNPVSGDYRTRSVTVIAGKQKTETVHKEYDVNFFVDVEKTYFSPRLATERKRVSALIQKNAIVYDMFCGVAPFSILIAKYAQPKKIIAVDKNPYAIELAKKNIKENKVSSTIKVLCEDAKNTENIIRKENIVPNHIIMNLPFSAFQFFSVAVQSLSHNGIIHYYDIIDKQLIDKRCDELRKIAHEKNIVLEKMKIHKIKTYAPHEFYIGIDITVSKN